MKERLTPVEFLKLARELPQNERTPYAFEKRIMAHIGCGPVADTVSEWAHLLWRAMAPCVARVEWAVIAAGRFIPRTTCLTRALTLHRLLSRSGYRSNVQFGIRYVDGRFAAHAWVEHEARLLLSKPSDIARYVRLFAWPPSQPDLS